MSLPLFPTTLAGSLPKPAWLAEPEKLWAPWKQEGVALQSAKEDAAQLWLKIQEDAGVDIVTDGEQFRTRTLRFCPACCWPTAPAVRSARDPAGR